MEDDGKLPPQLYAHQTPLDDRDAVARLLCAVAVLEERRIQGEAARHARKDAEPDSWVQLVDPSSNLFTARNEQTGQVVKLRPPSPKMETEDTEDTEEAQEAQETLWKTIRSWRNGSTDVKLKGKVDGESATFTGPDGSSVTFEVVDAEGRPDGLRVMNLAEGVLYAQAEPSSIPTVESYFSSGKRFVPKGEVWDEIPQEVLDCALVHGKRERLFSFKGDIWEESTRFELAEHGRKAGVRVIRVGTPKLKDGASTRAGMPKGEIKIDIAGRLLLVGGDNLMERLNENPKNFLLTLAIQREQKTEVAIPLKTRLGEKKPTYESCIAMIRRELGADLKNRILHVERGMGVRLHADVKVVSGSRERPGDVEKISDAIKGRNRRAKRQRGKSDSSRTESGLGRDS